MTKIVPGRQTVHNDRDIVVFIIGARVNKWWLLPISLPILSRMRKMLAELTRDPESGFLGAQQLGFGGMVQYWRSVDDLLRYASDPKREHKPTAKRTYQKIFDNQAVGIWHETYAVPAGHYECTYGNMPRLGLGKIKPLVEAKGKLATAKGRLAPDALTIGRTSTSRVVEAA